MTGPDKALGGPCQLFKGGPFLSLPFSHPVPHPFAEVFSSAIKINITLFSVRNLRSTTYSRKLISALHTLTAF